VSGKFIVIYGANNLGKTIQTRLLTKKFIDDGENILLVKYPIYTLKPTGPKINKILRDPSEKDRNIKEFDFQKLYTQNRYDFQSTLKLLLSSGFTVLAEDYLGTGIAWGVTNSIKNDGEDEKNITKLINKFENLNKGLLKPDIAILLDGERFLSGIEKKHRNEDRGNSVWDLNRRVYKKLAERYSWKSVKANQSIESVHNDIWKIILKSN
jgi:thymidylate kinase